MVTFAIVWCLSRAFRAFGMSSALGRDPGACNLPQATTYTPACTFFADVRYTLAAPVTAGEAGGGVPCPPRP